MGYDSSITGGIEGISEDSYELIREDLEDVFQTVEWYNNMLDIDSYGPHYQEKMYPLYDKIAFCIDEGGGGELYYKGDENTDMWVIFFMPGKWKMEMVDIVYPENPLLPKEKEDTVGTSSSIEGTISGITEDSYELIREDMEDVFVNVAWVDDCVEIDSYGKHNARWVYPVFDKIAFCINEGGTGELLYNGEGATDLWKMFFAPGRWKELPVQIVYPENPFLESESENQKARRE